MSASNRCNRNNSKTWSYPVIFLTPASIGRSRAALLAGASLVALAAVGASGVARAACVPSPQIIDTPTSGTIFSNGGAITVTGSGSIAGDPDGVDALTCSITTLTNQSGGMISGGTGRTSAPGGAGVANARTIRTLTNSGTISGGSGGFNGAGGAGVSNVNGSTIRSLSNALAATITGGTGGPFGGGDAAISGGRGGSFGSGFGVGTGGAGSQLRHDQDADQPWDDPRRRGWSKQLRLRRRRGRGGNCQFRHDCDADQHRNDQRWSRRQRP